MPIPVSDVVDSVGKLLTDEDHVRWTVPELIDWINEAAGAILVRRPSANARRDVISLVQGAAQTLPADSVQLLDVVRNIGADGTTPGSVIRRSDRQAIDDSDPDWHMMTPKASVAQYTFDDRMPKLFYVYPPVIAGTKVEVLHSALPAQVASETDDVAMGYEYLEAMVNYVAYRANSKDSEYANAAVAAAFYGAFKEAIGVQNQTAVASSPNQPTNSV